VDTSSELLDGRVGVAGVAAIAVAVAGPDDLALSVQVLTIALVLALWITCSRSPTSAPTPSAES
jgi:hypothetical protein